MLHVFTCQNILSCKSSLSKNNVEFWTEELKAKYKVL